MPLSLRRLLLAAALAATLRAQTSGTCACGTDPPGPPKNRENRPYANTPEDLRPYGKFTVPYDEFYQKQVEYNGAARDAVTLKPRDVDEVRIGFLGPIENHPDEPLGRMMLNGALLAIEEANARGGYGGTPFKLMVHNDQALWGASSNEIVKMAYDEKVWAMLGSLGADSTHIGLRVSLKAELPIVNSASTDPTIPETIIPWYLATLQDDRVQSYTLARRIYTDLGLTRVALLRVNDRYGRFGVLKFKDAARRLGHPVTIEQKYVPGSTDFKRSLGIIADSNAEAIVIWGDQAPAAAILKQMRELGMKQRVFGSFRTIGADARGRCRTSRRRHGSGIPLRPEPRRPRLDRLSRPLRQTIRPAAGGVRVPRLRHHEHPARCRLPRRIESRKDPRCVGRPRKLQGSHGRNGVRPQLQEHRPDVSGHRPQRRDPVSAVWDGEALREGRRRRRGLCRPAR